VGSVGQSVRVTLSAFLDDNVPHMVIPVKNKILSMELLPLISLNLVQFPIIHYRFYVCSTYESRPICCTIHFPTFHHTCTIITREHILFRYIVFDFAYVKPTESLKHNPPPPQVISQEDRYHVDAQERDQRKI
jgi:hypothetical protein